MEQARVEGHRTARREPLWVFSRRERPFDELAAKVGVFWTEDGFPLKAHLDFLKPRCVVVG